MEGQEKFRVNVHGGEVRPVEFKEWVPPSQRTPEGKASWDAAIEEMHHYGAVTEAEAAQKVHDVLTEPVEFEGLTYTPTQHWGIWHPKEKHWWWASYSNVWTSTNRAVAEAQLTITKRQGKGLTYMDFSLYEVRCIEEWADEQRQQ